MYKCRAFFLVLYLLSFSTTLPGQPITDKQNVETILLSSVSRLLPGSTICYYWWCANLNVELAENLVKISNENSKEASANSDQTESDHDQTMVSGVIVANAEYDGGSEKSISDLIGNENFLDSKTHNTDVRSRPRPRKRGR